VKLRLTKRFVWKCQYAVRIKKKGRARGEIITGLEGQLWRIMSIYNNNSMKSKRREIEETLGDLEEEILYIGEDFNARIGKEGKKIEREEDEEPWRNSKDKEVNNEGKELLGLVEDRGLYIANGKDERG